MIEVHDYSPEWVEKFETLRSKVWPIISDFADRIEHVGSTSVVGLAAKPVIDLDIVIESEEKLPPIIEALKTIGYEHVGDLGIKGREMFKHPKPEFKHNLYVCLDKCLSFRNHITLRDHLRSNPEDRAKYGNLKKELAEKYSDDIDSYLENKTEFILSILKQYGVGGNELEEIQQANKKPVVMNLNKIELEYWNSYLSTLDEKPTQPMVEASIAGNEEIADQLLDLYLMGKKTAGSGLVKDYELSGDDLPKVGNYWIILDSQKVPRCIVKTVRVEIHQFDQVPKEVAIAEGEGDLSLEYWQKAHIEFFTPFLENWKIDDLNKEQVVTEFFEVVYK